ncbi:MAG TPA: FecR domain-containing protein [Mucilaginibacter sp.]|jgi:ferric-dicitrate binding protein FerR (iron transport regulator)|nr:FecR domain-containing protein [Mucilaginibacter sp.]
MSRIDMEELFDRYLKGEASPAEMEKVEAWLDHYQHPHTEWQQMDKSSREKWLEGLYGDVQESIAEPKVVALRPRRVWWRVAAAAAAMLLLGLGVYLERPQGAQLVVLSVAPSQKSQVVLADGSKVWVNSKSTFTYPKAFDGKTREVYLAGEAFFDIQHDAAKPFIIHTGKIVTTVLGTAFNIKVDSLQHTVVVTVTRGKVSVANGSHLLGVITPNQQISVNTVNHMKMQKTVNAGVAVAWQQNAISFNDITFADAAAQLQQRFKVKIIFANDKVKNCRFTGSALREEKLDKILKVICTFNNATYQTKADGSIVIDGPGCD